VVFEDLHWIDAETQALLDGLVESLRKTYYSQLRLDALPPESTGELPRALLGDDPALELLKRLLVKRGNPFFIEESIRTLVETGALTGEHGAHRLTRAVQAIEVPGDRPGDPGSPDRPARSGRQAVAADRTRPRSSSSWPRCATAGR
jgi:predicted ATPase